MNNKCGITASSAMNIELIKVNENFIIIRNAGLQIKKNL